MRVKYLASIIVLLVLLTWSVDSRAQDGMPGSDLNGLVGPDPNSYDEKPLLLESEGRNTKSILDSTGVSRTPLSTPVSKKSATPGEGAKKKEESDPLNFNFLFYIIQTFKSSDLMMEN